jgi:membrane-anchored protein YejM (alkaline phosphatase superfamily)
VVDGYVWQQYRLHLDASIWNLVTGGAFGETFVFATRTWLKLGFVVLALGAALAACAWLAAQMVRRPGRRAGMVLALSPRPARTCCSSSSTRGAPMRSRLK